MLYVVMKVVLFLLSIIMHAYVSVSLSALNSATYSQSAAVGHNVAPSVESPKRVLVPPSAPNPGTYIPHESAVVDQKAAPSLESRKMVRVPPSAPNPTYPAGTFMPPSTPGQGTGL
ncbi:hypothetical protein SLA2020_445340 [Shorea laevis]